MRFTCMGTRGRSDTERSCHVQQHGSTMCRKVDACDMTDMKKKNLGQGLLISSPLSLVPQTQFALVTGRLFFLPFLPWLASGNG